MHAPGEAVATGGVEDLVLLRVVEVGRVQPRLLLAERGVRHDSRGVRLEGAEIVLEPRHQSHVPDRAGGLQRRQQVAHRSAVDRDVLGLGLLPRPRSDRDDLRPDPVQGSRQTLAIAQVGLHRRDLRRRRADRSGTGRTSPSPSPTSFEATVWPTIPVTPTTSALLPPLLIPRHDLDHLDGTFSDTVERQNEMTILFSVAKRYRRGSADASDQVDPVDTRSSRRVATPEGRVPALLASRHRIDPRTLTVPGMSDHVRVSMDNLGERLKSIRMKQGLYTSGAGPPGQRVPVLHLADRERQVAALCRHLVLVLPASRRLHRRLFDHRGGRAGQRGPGPDAIDAELTSKAAAGWIPSTPGSPRSTPTGCRSVHPTHRPHLTMAEGVRLGAAGGHSRARRELHEDLVTRPGATTTGGGDLVDPRRLRVRLRALRRGRGGGRRRGVPAAPGESLGFDSTIPHVLRNVGTEVFEGIWFVHGHAH